MIDKDVNCSNDTSRKAGWFRDQCASLNNWAKSKIRGWLDIDWDKANAQTAVDGINNRMCNMSHAIAAAYGIGESAMKLIDATMAVDLGFHKTPTTVIISSHVGGGRVIVKDLGIHDYSTLMHLVAELQARYQIRDKDVIIDGGGMGHAFREEYYRRRPRLPEDGRGVSVPDWRKPKEEPGW